MSYGEAPQGISTDRAIQLIAEAREHDDFLYRTLFGNKSLPHVVYQLDFSDNYSHDSSRESFWMIYGDYLKQLQFS